VGRSVWWQEVIRVLAVCLFAAAIGTLSGYVLPLLLLAMAGLLVYWLLQLRRVARWLRRPDTEPPEATGLWGEIFDRVYHLQRADREERGRLQTTVSYLRDSFAALKNATVMIDPQGNIEWCNAASARLLGLQYPRDRGQAILNLVRLPAFNAYVDGGDYQEPLLMDSPRDGGARLLIEITPFGAGSRLLFARDVTREERMQEMRRDFIANVSHELRTPLTVITGYLHTLLDAGIASDERIHQPLVQMRQQARRMENLLRDLLWLSRLESAQDESEDRAALDIAEIMSEVRTEALGVEPDREINLVVESRRELPGNYRQIHSALSNLVVNALKYSDGPVEMRWSEDEGHLYLSVTDVGPGIDAVHIPRLTERFYRVEKSRAQETGGTGLGLAIVKHVLAAHQAWLDIDSRLGRGTTFRCVFPLS